MFDNIIKLEVRLENGETIAFITNDGAYVADGYEVRIKYKDEEATE